MMSRRSIAFLVCAAAALAGCVGIASRAAVTGALDTAMADSIRTAEERARDRYRHPRETLLFFGLRPNQTVVEILPGGGWYTKIIAPIVADRGRYIAALPPVIAGNPGSERGRQNFLTLLAAAPAQLGRVQVADFDVGKGSLAPGTADLVVTFRELHGWMADGVAPAALADIHRVLKPGGVFGLVGHRGNAALPQDPKAGSGYVNQDYAIKLVEAAGFRLVATSEINANPKDTKAYPGGVWTLPPTFAEGAKDRERYLAIGESDRFTLKFIKPR
jgi:predicted methyltransferase